MRYQLKRNSKGMITQCDTNADGGNIYARRDEISKQALANLERPTPGKLGGLSNLQIFNFSISDFNSGTTNFVFNNYNTTNSFPANATQVVMFGVPGLNSKAQYYNIIDVKAQVFTSVARNYKLEDDSFIEFYLLQNIETSTTSLGTKIPQPAPIFGSGGGSVTFTTTGDIQGHQYFGVSLGDDSINIPSDLKGLRASGLALKTINLQFTDNEVTDDLVINLQVMVDTTSVSQTY